MALALPGTRKCTSGAPKGRTMAKLKHVAIATQDTESTTNFYRDVFDLEVVGRVDGDNAEGYYLSDGNVNMSPF